MKLSKYWTEEKIKKLKNSYENLSKTEILKIFPEYKWRSIQNVANFLGFKKTFSEIRKGKIDKLFNKSFESFYWLGLIVTDGYISDTGELKVELVVTDYDYLSGLSKFLESNILKFPVYKSTKPNGKGTCRVKIKDIDNGQYLRKLLGIENKKTYNPINLDFITNRLELVSFLGGYIDGDGTISINGDLKIDAHKNYDTFLNNFGELLIKNEIINSFKITKYEDMVRIGFSRKDTRTIKKMLIDLNLPIMKRKWDRVII